ncbi:4591_t:CDS:2, partial [Gigaspora margarita]
DQCSVKINYKLPCSHIIPKEESQVNDSEFYKIFLKAEEMFCKLPDDISIRAKLIAHIDQAITMHFLSLLKLQILLFQKNINVYKNSIPKFMNEYILSYTNVCGNGNCVFCAIATSLEMSKNEWPVIKHTIFNELEKGPCGVNNWMLMPSFGYPIANAFQRPIHYF